MIEMNANIKNPLFVKALNTFVKEKNELNEFNFIKELILTKFLSPCKVTGKYENRVLKKGTNISFYTIKNKSGEIFYPIFTDVIELRKWTQESVETMLFTYDQYMTLISDDEECSGIVINPFEQNLIIDKRLINYINIRRKGIEIKKGTKVMVGEPASLPQDFMNEMTNLFERIKVVKKAYIGVIIRENDDKPNLILIIDHNTDSNILYPEISQISHKFLNNNDFLDIVDYNTDFGKTASAILKSFYNK